MMRLLMKPWSQMSRGLRVVLATSALIGLLIAPVAALGQYQVVFDVEDPCFEIYSGAWTLEKTGTYLGSFYYAISGPGTGAGTARWTAEGLPAGSYLVECWANNGNYASDARYQVICSDGAHSVSLNMNYVTAGWYSLGTYSIDRVCVVNVSDYWTGSGTLLSVDALRFTYQGTVPAPPATDIVPHIGVCIDDAGSVNPTDPAQPIYSMLRLPFPLTIAVMPQRTYTTQTANEVYARGSEVILHQPMAAITVPDPGAGGITSSMTLEQVRTVVSTNLNAVPHCIGMNNHMGSLITQQTDKMQVCMEELKARDQFFYDSRTITTSVGYDVAKNNGLLTAERDLFIDGNSKEESKALIRSLALRALHAPYVTHCAIGHVRANTAAALQEMVSELEAMGVEIWPISRCMTQIIETDNQPSGCSVSLEGAWIADTPD
ncbi:MAG TPA: divergent polysaccharide deacetylase family protein, partial [bacterium]|nr:divergent polysaccharide deacetylase family protein [bacterium]